MFNFSWVVPGKLAASGMPGSPFGGFFHGPGSLAEDLRFAAEQNKVHVHDLHATLLHLLGFDHEKFTYRYAGRDFRLTDVHGSVVRGILAE